MFLNRKGVISRYSGLDVHKYDRLDIVGSKQPIIDYVFTNDGRFVVYVTKDRFVKMKELEKPKKFCAFDFGAENKFFVNQISWVKNEEYLLVTGST